MERTKKPITELVLSRLLTTEVINLYRKLRSNLRVREALTLGLFF